MALRRTGRFEVCVARRQAEVEAEIETAEALVIGNSCFEPVASAIYSKGKRLRWIQFSSSGSDALVHERLRSDIAVTRAVGVWTPVVAEHALALALALLRRLPEHQRQQGAKQWIEGAANLRMRSLVGMRALVIGFGDIGKTFARLAGAFGAEITAVATSRRVEDGLPVHAAAELPALLPRAELVVLTASGHRDKLPILGESYLGLLSPSAYLVNVGRGSLIDQDALCGRLAAGQLAGAALDVAAIEPVPADSPLWEAPNLILTPHVAGVGDRKALERLATQCATNAMRLLKNKEMIGLVRR